MKSLNDLLVSSYGGLLRLFPRHFRGEFGSEMVGVFAQTMARVGAEPAPKWKRRSEMVGLFLHEVVDLPAAIWSALHFQPTQAPAGGESLSAPESNEHGHQLWFERPSSWNEALLGAIPFILYGLIYLVVSIDEWSGPYPVLVEWETYATQAVYFLSLIGLVAGWVKGFPRWSYAYIGMCLHFAIDPFNEHFDFIIFGKQTWIALVLALLIALIISRSIGPLKQLFRGIWFDWTRVSFAGYAALIPILTIVFFDSDWGLGNIFGLAFDTLLLAAGAVLYLRCRNHWGRVISLPGAMFVLFTEWVLLYGWFLDIRPVLFWLGLMFTPGLIGLLRRGIGALQTRLET
jgi:hypothetical protein